MINNKVENKPLNKQTNKLYLQFGLLYGAIMVLSFVIIYTMNINIFEERAVGTTSSILNYFVLPLLFIYLGCQSFKRNNNGYIAFVECLKVGVSVVFVGILIFALFNVFFYYAFPDYTEEILSQTKQMMLKQNPNLTAAQLDMGISMSRKFSKPAFSFPITLAIFTFLGFLYSLFVGLIVKKDNPAGI